MTQFILFFFESLCRLILLFDVVTKNYVINAVIKNSTPLKANASSEQKLMYMMQLIRVCLVLAETHPTCNKQSWLCKCNGLNFKPW